MYVKEYFKIFDKDILVKVLGDYTVHYVYKEKTT